MIWAMFTGNILIGCERGVYMTIMYFALKLYIFLPIYSSIHQNWEYNVESWYRYNQMLMPEIYPKSIVCRPVDSYNASVWYELLVCFPIPSWKDVSLRHDHWCMYMWAALILGLRPANERRRYFVTTSLIGWAQAKNQPWWVTLYILNLCYILKLNGGWSCRNYCQTSNIRRTKSQNLNVSRLVL